MGWYQRRDETDLAAGRRTNAQMISARQWQADAQLMDTAERASFSWGED